MDLKPIVFFNDHTSFVTNLTCTSEGRLYTTGLDRRICVYNAPPPPFLPLTAACFCNTFGLFCGAIPVLLSHFMHVRPNQRRLSAIQDEQDNPRRWHYVMRVSCPYNHCVTMQPCVYKCNIATACVLV